MPKLSVKTLLSIKANKYRVLVREGYGKLVGWNQRRPVPDPSGIVLFFFWSLVFLVHSSLCLRNISI